MSAGRYSIVILSASVLFFFSMLMGVGVLVSAKLAVEPLRQDEALVWGSWFKFLVHLALCGLLVWGWSVWNKVYSRWIREGLPIDWDKVEPLC